MRNSKEKGTSSWSRVAQKRREQARFVPHPYQVDAMRFMVTRPAAGLLLDPGYGKTAITLHVFDTLRKAGHIDALIVLAKLRIVENTWPDEIAKWDLPLRWALLHGKDKDARLREQHHVYLMNYEGLPWLVGQKDLKRIFAGRRVMLVCDESSKLKDTGTARFKALKKLLPLMHRRHILTGSPVPQSLMDLFGQVYALDMGESFGPYITHFRNTYFVPSGYMGYDWKLQPGAEERIYERASKVLLRLPRDLIKLPELTTVNRWVNIPHHTMQVYRDLEKEFVGDLDSGRIVAANAAVASGKLRQFVGGAVYDETHRPHWLHDEKLDALEELVDELNGQQLFVAYEYQHELERILQRFPKTPHIGSGVDATTARQHMQDFNNGRIQMLLGHPQSVAHGLNLQASARNVVFFTLPWSFENYDQFIRRVWRQGQKNNVTVYQIVARDTIDEVVISVLSQKDATQQAFLKALEERYGKKKVTAKKK